LGSQRKTLVMQPRARLFFVGTGKKQLSLYSSIVTAEPTAGVGEALPVPREVCSYLVTVGKWEIREGSAPRILNAFLPTLAHPPLVVWWLNGYRSQ